VIEGVITLKINKIEVITWRFD